MKKDSKHVSDIYTRERRRPGDTYNETECSKSEEKSSENKSAPPREASKNRKVEKTQLDVPRSDNRRSLWLPVFLIKAINKISEDDEVRSACFIISYRLIVRNRKIKKPLHYPQPLHSSVLSRICCRTSLGRYREIMSRLVEEGILKEEGAHHKGWKKGSASRPARSKRYSILPHFFHSKWAQVTLSEKRSHILATKGADRSYRTTKDMSSQMVSDSLRHVSIRETASCKALLLESRSGQNQKGLKKDQLNVVRQIETHEFNLYRQGFSGRISHSISRLHKSLRRELRISGKECAEVDVIGAQLFLAGCTLYRPFDDETEKAAFFEMFAGDGPYVAISKDLHDAIPLEEVKMNCLKEILFRRDHRDARFPIWQAFQSRFPILASSISTYKKSHISQDMARLLQRAEAALIDRAIIELGDKRIPAIPIYDSFLLPEEYADDAKTALENAAHSIWPDGHIGVRIKHYN